MMHSRSSIVAVACVAVLAACTGSSDSLDSLGLNVDTTEPGAGPTVASTDDLIDPDVGADVEADVDPDVEADVDDTDSAGDISLGERRPSGDEAFCTVHADEDGLIVTHEFTNNEDAMRDVVLTYDLVRPDGSVDQSVIQPYNSIRAGEFARISSRWLSIDELNDSPIDSCVVTKRTNLWLPKNVDPAGMDCAVVPNTGAGRLDAEATVINDAAEPRRIEIAVAFDRDGVRIGSAQWFQVDPLEPGTTTVDVDSDHLASTAGVTCEIVAAGLL